MSGSQVCSVCVLLPSVLLSEDTAYVCTVIGSLNILTQAGSFGDVFMSGACFVSCHIQVLHTYTSVCGQYTSSECWSSSGQYTSSVGPLVDSVHLVSVGPLVVSVHLVLVLQWSLKAPYQLEYLYTLPICTPAVKQPRHILLYLLWEVTHGKD